MCFFFPFHLYSETIISTQNVSVSAKVGVEKENTGNKIIGSLKVQSSISFTGLAFPYASVFLFKDGQLVTSTFTDSSANFNFNINNISSGIYNFTIFAKSIDGQQSAVYTLPIIIAERADIKATNVFLSPTINLNKNNFTFGDLTTVSGQTTPNSQVIIYLTSATGHFYSFEVQSDNFGKYEYLIDSNNLNIDQFKIRAVAEFNGIKSFETITLMLNILDPMIKEISPESPDYIQCQTIFADLNCDQKVNLIDFSIMAYWYQKETPPSLIDLNKDGKIDLSDFSILAFNWTC